ncbi:GxxExxY protein [Flavobacterium sp. LB2P84]|jgi:GxxExxY protein|uniref:GxxExxY protein n=1 Tax=Flavobacterium TaxID=237 RepID=UPI000EB23E4D|nr:MULTISPECIES: GxxExxY protein [Flavobacterium]MDI6032628.1 GxxExxY protein [Flavobacterium yafengii]MDP3681854.1 GxxExxY protein [Flavobacterium sp.]MDZ4329119.1 GxxExxY protein [Flavobacterium sp.]RKS15906.1 GxxExxY protein [Flavobacterium sp. 120]
MTEILHKELSESILKVFYDVYNELGYGFLEKVYQNAMYLELKSQGFKVEPQKQIKVYYKNELVGDFFADLLINDLIILELKACDSLVKAHYVQTLNYLKATNIEIGLLLNFGERPEIKRLIFTNNRKN